MIIKVNKLFIKKLVCIYTRSMTPREGHGIVFVPGISQSCEKYLMVCQSVTFLLFKLLYFNGSHTCPFDETYFANVDVETCSSFLTEFHKIYCQNYLTPRKTHRIVFIPQKFHRKLHINQCDK